MSRSTSKAKFRPEIFSIYDLREILLCLITIALSAGMGNCQISGYLAVRRDLPTKVDTIYHPFHEGRQVIEVDHIGFRERSVRYHETHSPINSSWDLIIPQAPPNELLVRNAEGEILVAYNTLDGLDSVRIKWRAKLRERGFVSSPVAAETGTEVLVGSWTWGTIGNHPAAGRIPGYLQVLEKQKIGGSEQMKNANDWIARGQWVYKYGLIDSIGKIVLPVEYSAIFPFGGYILIEKGGRCGLLDLELKEVLPIEYDRYDFKPFGQLLLYRNERIEHMIDRGGKLFDLQLGYEDMDFMGLASVNWDTNARKRQFFVVRDGKMGLVDHEGHEVLAPKYDFIYPSFADGLSRVVRKHRWGYIDREGKEVIACQYEDAFDFDGGKAFVVRDGLSIWIDPEGNEVGAVGSAPIPWAKADDLWAHFGKMGYNLVQRENRFGVIDDKDRIVLPLIYEEILPVLEDNFNRRPMGGMFRVRMHGKFGVWAAQGNELLPVVYDEIGDFLKGYGFTTVKRGKQFGLIDRNMKVVLPTDYESIYPYWGNRLIVVKQSGRQGLVDSLGRTVVPLVYDQMWLPLEGYARVMRDSLYGIIDERGAEVIPMGQQDVHDRFIGGMIGVKQRGKWGFMDSTAKWVVAPQFDDVGGFFKRIAPVKMGVRHGFVNLAGKLVTECIYDRMRYEWEMDGLMEVWRSGKVGFVNENGKEVIPCIYDEVNASSIEQGHHLLMDGVWRWVKK